MKKFKILAICMAVLFAAGLAFAETPSTLKRNVWNAKQTFKHGVAVEGSVEMDSGVVSSTEIADVTRSIPLQLGAAINKYSVNAASPIQNWQAGFPGLTASYGIPAILWASGENASIGWGFMLPADYSSGLSFRMVASTNTQGSPTLWALRWALYVDAPGASIGSTPFSQASVPNSVTAPASKNILFTFSPDATAQASFAAGNFVTAFFWPIDQRVVSYFGTNGTTAMRSIEARYTSTQ